MSKIICELCGTAYPETSTHCPICGSVYSGDMSSISSDKTESGNEGSYTYVKGGRFSKANVRKRNRAKQSAENRTLTTQGSRSSHRPTPKKSNAGLVVTVIILLLAIAAIVLYLTFKFFWPFAPAIDTPEKPQTNSPTAPADTEISCEDLTVDVREFTLDALGSARMIYVTPSPANTTDQIFYSTSDPAVATVNENGKVEAVGPGEAVITIVCGDVQITCSVVCDFQDESTGATEEATEAATEPVEDFRLNRADITFSYQGEKWKLYSGDIDVSQITWSTDDAAVATIESGTVIAVGSGTTTVYGEYNGVKVSCIIRCAFSDSGYQGVGGHGGVGEDG